MLCERLLRDLQLIAIAEFNDCWPMRVADFAVGPGLARSARGYFVGLGEERKESHACLINGNGIKITFSL